METKHTPTPWRVSEYDSASCRAWITNTDDKGVGAIAEVTQWDGTEIGEQGEANAKFIVRACNNHESLCRALGEIATSVTYVLASKQCPAKMRGGLRAIADAATNALDKTLLAQADPAAGREPEEKVKLAGKE